MAVYPVAKWEPLPANSKQAHLTPRVVIIHRAVDAVGKTDLFGWFVQSGLESHFFVQLDGTVLQYMDTNVVAEANYRANSFAVSIETEDDGGAIPFTGAQVEAIVRLVDWLCTTHAIPRRQADRWDGSGIGWHSMWGINTKARPGLNPWTSALGKDCPSAPRIAQTRNVIIPRVAGGQVEETMTPEEISAGVAHYMRNTVRKGPDGQDRNLEDTIFQDLAWDAEALNTTKDQSDDEAKVLAALSGARGDILTAVASIPPGGQPSEQQITNLAARLRDGLGDELAADIGRRLLGQEGSPA